MSSVGESTLSLIFYHVYSFYGSVTPKWFSDNREPHSQAGRTKGLRIALDAHSDQLTFGTISDNFKGFTTVVSQKGSIPLATQEGFVVKPGQLTSVSISAQDVKANPDLISIDPIKRNCYFNGEYELNLFRHYSRANCVFECKLEYGREQMKSNCTPWYFPGKK